MKKLFTFGLIFGVATSCTSVLAQNVGGNSPGSPYREHTPILHRKLEKPVTKKVVKAVPKVAKKSGVAGAPAPKPFNFKPLYAENSISAANTTATDAGTGSMGPTNNKFMVNPPLTSPATTSTSSLADATKTEKKSPFNFKWRSLNALNLNSAESPGDPALDHEVQAWERFNFSYKLTDNISVSVMPQFYHTWFGDRDRSQSSSEVGLDQPYAFFMGDTGLYLIDSKIAQLGKWTIDGAQAYFFSTSEASIESGTVGQTRTSLGIGRSFGPIDIKWTESYWYYIQQYETSNIFLTSGEPMQNLNYQIWSVLDLGWNVNKKFSINLEGGFINQATLADTNTLTARNAVLDDYVVLDPEIDYSFNDHFTLGLGIWEQYDMRQQPVTVTAGTGASAVPVAWLPQYFPFDYRNGSQVYLQTTLKF